MDDLGGDEIAVAVVSALVFAFGGIGAKVVPPLEFGAPLSTAPGFD